jgi:predicted small secreted protein
MRSFWFANCNTHLNVGDDIEVTVEAAVRVTTAPER